MLSCLLASGAGVATACFSEGSAGEDIAKALGGGASGIAATCAVVAWIASVKDEKAYFPIVKQVLALHLPAAGSASSFKDLGALQFGTGGVSSATAGSSSLLGAGMLPSYFPIEPEISAYASQQGYELSLTFEQATAFLETFSYLGNVTSFLHAAVVAAQAHMKSDIPAAVEALTPYAATGVMSTKEAAHIFATYLSEYLPKRLIVPSMFLPIGTDGIFGSNSGMFTRRSPKEILEGWVDPVIAQLDPTVKYNGVVGKVYPDWQTQKETEDADPRRTTQASYGSLRCTRANRILKLQAIQSGYMA
jgi:hypothetical protein